jgi:signal transduction histidine kinase/ligand-binding sensor domain-containing protein
MPLKPVPLALLVVLAAALPVVDAQSVAGRYYFDSWTTDNGLPQNSVNAILQTRDGYLWIATADGLVRYDGARFAVFNQGNTPGMNDNRCYSLLEDRAGALWIRNQFGLMSYRDGFVRSYTAADGLPAGIVQLFEDDHDGLILISNRGIFLWRNGQSSSIGSLGGAPGTFGYKDKSGAIWCNVGTDLACLTAEGRLIRYRKAAQGPYGWLVCMHEDRRGNYWVGTYTGLYRLIDGKFVRYVLTGDIARAAIACISEDAQGVLWVSTMSGRLFQLAINRASAAAPTANLIDFNPTGAPAGNHADVIFSDREGTIWLGTNSYGLLRANKQVVTVYSKRDGLSSDSVYPVYEDRERAVWIGNWQGRVTRFKDGKFTPAWEWTLPTALAEDRDGNLWMGKNVGLVRFNGGNWTEEDSLIGFTGRDYEVDAIHQDREGRMWFGTNQGLVSYRDGARKLYTTIDGLAGNEVKVILEDRQGALWFGTYGGLNRLKEGKFTSYKKSDGLASDHVRALYEDGGGVLWVGTYDGGLSRIEDGRITTYTTNDGLFNNGVFQILDDQRGNFWMSSNLGIYRVSRQELNDFADGKIHKITCVSYGKRDGMLNVECNGGTSPAGVRTRDGRLWFPTQKGVAVIDPADVPVNLLPPPVLIDGFAIDGLSAVERGMVKILPGQEGLEIHYTGLSFIDPEQVRFRYRMEGLDKDWVEAGARRAAFYSHLPPGRYTFNVVAANASGVWNLVGASLDVTVEPPFWRTWWFSIVVVAGLVAIAIVVYRRRVAMLKQAAAAQEAFSRRLIKSQEIERKRIAAELHDGLQQSLSIIANRASLALDKREDPDRAFDQVSEIVATASDALKEVREIAYNLRPVELDRLGLTKALRAMVKKVSGSSRINISAGIDEIDRLFSTESEINLYRIVQESINNIVKHSGATEASVVITQAESGLVITIHDNGKGFDTQSVSAGDLRIAGFGLMGIYERTRILGGRYTIESAPGLGTTINIQIDLKEDGDGRQNSNRDSR